MRVIVTLLVGVVVGFGVAAEFYGNGGMIFVMGHPVGPVMLPAAFTGGSGCGPAGPPCVVPVPPVQNSGDPPATVTTNPTPPTVATNPGSVSGGNSVFKRPAGWLYIVWPQ